MTQSERLEIPLLSGASFPDWSVVSSDKVRKSLSDRLGRLRMTTCWQEMTEPEETIRCAVLTLYVRFGKAPKWRGLAHAMGISLAETPALLSSLADRFLLVLSSSVRMIEPAYPFTDHTTKHRVSVGDITLNAMRAIHARR